MVGDICYSDYSVLIRLLSRKHISEDILSMQDVCKPWSLEPWIATGCHVNTTSYSRGAMS
jgi:hypothetical protein